MIGSFTIPNDSFETVFFTNNVIKNSIILRISKPNSLVTHGVVAIKRPYGNNKSNHFKNKKQISKKNDHTIL